VGGVGIVLVLAVAIFIYKRRSGPRGATVSPAKPAKSKVGDGGKVVGEDSTSAKKRELQALHSSSKRLSELQYEQEALKDKLETEDVEPSEKEQLRTQLDATSKDLEATRQLVKDQRERVKELEAKTAAEARAEARDAGDTFHLAMFEVADSLGDKAFSTLRDTMPDTRFGATVNTLIFGQPQQAARGIEYYMCISEAEMIRRLSAGNSFLAAMRSEIEQNGTEDDKECCKYVCDMEAGSSDKTFQGGQQRDCDRDGNLLPSRQRPDGKGMTLADFLDHMDAVEANLDLAEAAALRLYTTKAYQTINNDMRDEERYQAGREHRLPVTVYLIQKALKKLRAVEAKKPERANETVELYRGLRNLKMADGFVNSGGTELAPMSTTSSLKIAMQYSVSEKSLLLRIKTSDFMNRGPDISWLSAFPTEKEFLFPPLTYMRATGPPQLKRIDDVTYTVVEVSPSFS